MEYRQSELGYADVTVFIANRLRNLAKALDQTSVSDARRLLCEYASDLELAGLTPESGGRPAPRA